MTVDAEEILKKIKIYIKSGERKKNEKQQIARYEFFHNLSNPLYTY